MPKLTILLRERTVTTNIPSGCTFFKALINCNIPPESVVVRSESGIHTDSDIVRADLDYTAVVPESYDLDKIMNIYEAESTNKSGYYTARRVTYTKGRDVKIDQETLKRKEFEEYLEQTIQETSEYHNLISPGDTVLLGLSGEGDSMSLLYLLNEIDIDITLIAVTIEEPWNTETTGCEKAVEHTSRLDIPHYVVSIGEIQDMYNLETNLELVLRNLKNTEQAYLYEDILGQIHKTALERIAINKGANKICLASHSSELISNILMSNLFGLDSKQGTGIPKEVLGDLSYIYPACYTTKKELYLYHLSKVGEKPTDTTPDIWQDLPTSESFQYFIGNILQSYWPGIEHWLIQATESEHGTTDYICCGNCEKRRSTGDLGDKSYLCPVCDELAKLQN